jgi:hypothetical protein
MGNYCSACACDKEQEKKFEYQEDFVNQFKDLTTLAKKKFLRPSSIRFKRSSNLSKSSKGTSNRSSIDNLKINLLIEFAC